MGSDRSGTHLRGILVPDPRLVAANLVSKTHGTVPSSYTEAGPFTGLAVADQDTNLEIRASGSQSADCDLEIRTSRSGGIGADGAEFQWRDVAAGDTTSEYKGRDATQLVTDFEPLLYTTSADAVALKPTLRRRWVWCGSSGTTPRPPRGRMRRWLHKAQGRATSPEP
jgi:hypothetical protein